MHHRIKVEVGPRAVPFIFHICEASDQNPLLASGKNIGFDFLIHTATRLCNQLDIDHCEIFVVAGPDKGEKLEATALNMMEGLHQRLNELGVQHRTMERNTGIPNIDMVDAIVFNLKMPA